MTGKACELSNLHSHGGDRYIFLIGKEGMGETVIGATSSQMARAGPTKQRPEGERRSTPCQQPGKGTPSKGSEAEGEVSLLKEPQWLPGLRARG